MARTIFTEIALFIAPFAIYVAILYLTKRDARDRDNWGAKVVAWLAFAGIILVAISLVWLSHYGGYRPRSTYIPAHIDKGGKFVPGYTK